MTCREGLAGTDGTLEMGLVMRREQVAELSNRGLDE